MKSISVHVKLCGLVGTDFNTVILPEVKQIHDLHILGFCNLLQLPGIPAGTEQRILLRIPVASLLLDQNDLHALFLGTLGHIGDVFPVLITLIIFGIVDADGNNVHIPRLAVILDRCELSGIEKAFCPLSGCRHVADVPALDIVPEHLSPAALCAGVKRIVIANGRVTADPDGRRKCRVIGDLLNFQRTDRERRAVLARAGANVELSVRDRNQNLIDRIISGHIDNLEHTLHVNTRARGVSKRDLDTVQPLRQINIEGRCPVGELHGI